MDIEMKYAGCDIPKNIWILWFQGYDDAPLVVKNCIKSWQKKNPGWVVNILDADNLDLFTTVHHSLGRERPDLSLQHQADIIRVDLIAKHGGVWVDATCFCCSPLDDWIHKACEHGFFAYQGHRKDTIISNWFMASHREAYLTTSILAKIKSFVRENVYPIKQNIRMYRVLKLAINWNQKLTGLWFSFFVRRVLKVRPYFWFHYLFAELLKEDSECSRLWGRTLKLDAVVPHKVKAAGYLNKISLDIRNNVDGEMDKVYKLNWKLHKFDANADGNTYPEDSNIGYVLNSVSDYGGPQA